MHEGRATSRETRPREEGRFSFFRLLLPSDACASPRPHDTRRVFPRSHDRLQRGEGAVQELTVWDVGGQEKLRPLWRHYFNNTDGLIFVVDSLDRDRIDRAKEEFTSIINDPFMRNSAILIFANKQDMKNCLSAAEIAERMGLAELRGRRWHVQSAVATQGLGLYEGLDWLSDTLKQMQARGVATSVGTSGERGTNFR